MMIIPVTQERLKTIGALMMIIPVTQERLKTVGALMMIIPVTQERLKTVGAYDDYPRHSGKIEICNWMMFARKFFDVS